ncbi:MAG: amidohydrolase [Betaproteobacteria bacterium]|nr:MAG: amidohydrolase [Betaproteobacteria bacterium]
MAEEPMATLRGFQDELAVIRRDIHRHPETAFQEERTAGIVAAKLAEFGIEVSRGLARTGVVGTLRGRRPGARAIALRADMDALNLEEQNPFAHRSVHAGKMHACGHDGHTAMLLGAARYLAQNPAFAGTVHFIFQPAEEGEGGARVMLEEGLFERHRCDAVYGMHNMPGLAAGHFAIRPGAMLASSDSWTATFRGTGGHGAMPERGTDPTLPAAAFVLATQTIVGRNVASHDAAVVSVGHLQAGSFAAPNVIPAQVVVRGTARSFARATRELIERRLGELARSLAQAYGCEAQLDYERRYPVLVNAPEQTRIAMDAAAMTVGADKVDGNTQPLAGAEDFAFMLERKAGAYIAIGNGGLASQGGCHNVHTPRYDFNDEILATGAAYWVNLVRRELGPGA